MDLLKPTQKSNSHSIHPFYFYLVTYFNLNMKIFEKCGLRRNNGNANHHDSCFNCRLDFVFVLAHLPQYAMLHWSTTNLEASVFHRCIKRSFQKVSNNFLPNSVMESPCHHLLAQSIDISQLISSAPNKGNMQLFTDLWFPFHSQQYLIVSSTEQKRVKSSLIPFSISNMKYHPIKIYFLWEKLRSHIASQCLSVCL